MVNISVGGVPGLRATGRAEEPFELCSGHAQGPLMFVFYRGDW